MAASSWGRGSSPGVFLLCGGGLLLGRFLPSGGLGLFLGRFLPGGGRSFFLRRFLPGGRGGLLLGRFLPAGVWASSWALPPRRGTEFLPEALSPRRETGLPPEALPPRRESGPLPGALPPRRGRGPLLGHFLPGGRLGFFLGRFFSDGGGLLLGRFLPSGGGGFLFGRFFPSGCRRSFLLGGGKLGVVLQGGEGDGALLVLLLLGLGDLPVLHFPGGHEKDGPLLDLLPGLLPVLGLLLGAVAELPLGGGHQQLGLAKPGGEQAFLRGAGLVGYRVEQGGVVALVHRVPVEALHRVPQVPGLEDYSSAGGVPGLVVFAFQPDVGLVEKGPADDDVAEVPGDQHPAALLLEDFLQGDGPLPGHAGGGLLPVQAPA